MGDFFSIGTEITKGFIEGFAGFWAWFINPIFSIDITWLMPESQPLVIAPWMILSFTTLIVIFVVSLAHLLNPLG